MSDAPKPAVEQPVEALASETTPAPEPVPEVKPTEEATTETPAVTEPTATEEAAPVKEEVKPVEEGILGYKGPGLLKSFIFQKKFFWFGSEPVDVKSLTNYLRGEKSDANINAAWASYTGKGLFFFSKKATDKASPAGIINLSEASDPVNDGTIAFYFTVGGHKHTFETTTLAERDNWVSVLKTKIAEAKELAPAVKEDETYKKTLESFKPVPTAAAVVAPKKSTEVKKEEKVEKAEAKEEKKEEKAEAKEEKKEEKKEVKERKSRSASRKRTSIFGSIPGFGKKEEKAEAKEETPVAPAADEPATEPVVEPTPAPEAPVVAAEPEVPATEEAAAPVEAKPATTKRNSIFGTLKSQFSHHTPKEKKAEDAPAVPAKDAEPVSETAPVIPAVESTEPLATSVASPATVPVEETATPVTNGETKTDAPIAKSEKRKTSLPWLTKKDKPTSDEETEKPKSPFAKLRATVKGKSSPKAEKAAEKPAEETPAAEAKPEEPVVSEPTPVVSTSTPQVSATA